MSFKLIGNHLSPSDGEIVVRTYHCTYLSPIFALIGLKTDGYLTVTNKRVVYFAEGSSVFGVAGYSKLYNEVSIADVSNLSLGKGTRFSFLRLLLGLIFSQVAGAAAALILSGVMLVLKGADGGGSPYSLRFRVFLQLAAAVILVARSASISRESIVRVMLAASGLSLVLSVPVLGLSDWSALMSMPPIYLAGIAILGIPMAVYWLWCLYWFIRREYLTMEIASKSGLATPIRISGMSWWGRINVAAGLASRMAAAVDADIMFKELGAVVTDIQTMGDHGVEKWLENKAPAIDENLNRQDSSYSRAIMRYALAAILLIGVFIGGESILYSITAKKNMALGVQTELAYAKKNAERDTSVRELVPKMWTAAEQESIAGETAFEKNHYEESMRHWHKAIKAYADLPNAAAAMKAADEVQAKYNALMAGTYVQESVSDRLKNGAMMSDFTALMNQHPSSNDNWKAVGLGVDKAKLNADQDKWGPSGIAWEYAGARLSPAVQLMRADLSVGLAEKAIKEGDARGAYDWAVNALGESSSHPDAGQRKELAGNMLQYAKQLNDAIDSGTVNARNMAEFTAQLDLFGGADWAAIKGMVENAKAFANQNEWDKCNSEWKTALDKLPATILVMQREKARSDLALQMEKAESEARRGNWDVVSVLAGKVLAAHPDHQRAKELKDKADSIEGAMASKRDYEQALSNALVRENNSNHIKMGDMSDFNALMDRYGHEEWVEVKETVNRASKLSDVEQGAESSNEWVKACAQLQAAVQRMHAELWIEQAEQEAKSTNWAKAVVYAENALKDKPGHVRARELRDQADGIEEMKVLSLKYDQLFKDAADKIGDIGCTAGDQEALTSNLVQYAGSTWDNVKNNIAKAKEYEAQGRHSECVDSWAGVYSSFPVAIHEMRAGYWVGKAENDAKSNLWAKVSLYVDNALKEKPDDMRAKQMKDQVNQVEELLALQNEYDQALRKAADEMPAMGGAAGDQNGLMANLAQYGGKSWTAVAEKVKKASELDKQGKRTDSIALWKEVLSTFPSAMSKTHAGYWVDKAENDAKAQLWGKVSIEAEKALAKEPENERAKALKAEAEKNSK